MSIHTDEALLKLIGNRIREVRKEQNLSLRDVAFKIGMEPSNLSVIENGRSNPQILTFARIASALSVELSTIVTIEFDFQSFGEQAPSYQARKHKK
jgi:transcriptional regulator with XRE-family HTH domain